MGCGACDRARKRQLALIQAQINADIVKTNKAFLVVGLEATGDKAVMTILKNMRVDCDDLDRQKWDGVKPNTKMAPLIAIRRSFPHGKIEDIVNQYEKYKAYGYNVFVLNIVRTHYPCLMESLQLRHIQTEAEKMKQIKRYWLELSKLECNVYNITYESLTEPNTIKWLYKLVTGKDMPKDFNSGFKNQNSRY